MWVGFCSASKRRLERAYCLAIVMLYEETSNPAFLCIIEGQGTIYPCFVNQGVHYGKKLEDNHKEV